MYTTSQVSMHTIPAQNLFRFIMIRSLQPFAFEFTDRLTYFMTDWLSVCGSAHKPLFKSMSIMVTPLG